MTDRQRVEKLRDALHKASRLVYWEPGWAPVDLGKVQKICNNALADTATPIAPEEGAIDLGVPKSSWALLAILLLTILASCARLAATG